MCRDHNISNNNNIFAFSPLQKTMVVRRDTTPQELADPDDCMVNDAAEASAYAAVAREALDEEGDPAGAATAAALAHHHTNPHIPLTTSTTGSEIARRASTSWSERMSTLPLEIRNLLSGGIAGMVAKTFVAPLDRIKILYQVSSAKFHVWNVPTVVRNIVKNEGFPALWKGNMATMIRVFPYSGVQFMVYDRCKLFFLHEHERGIYVSFIKDHSKWGLTPVESLIAGMVAGTVSVVVTYPLDLTRAQLAVLRRHRDGIPTKSFMTVLMENYTNRGLVGLYRGITPTLMGILPYSGVAFTLNEQGKKEVRVGVSSHDENFVYGISDRREAYNDDKTVSVLNHF